MKGFCFWGFLVLMLVDTFAQICFKFAGAAALPFAWEPAWVLRVLTSPWVYGAIFCYGAAFVTWMTILRQMAVGPSFAASHLELVSVTAISVWLFNEPLNAYKLAGGACILLGVGCLAVSEQKSEKSCAEQL